MFTGVETTASALLECMRSNGIDLALVMPQPTRDDIHAYHDRIAADVADSGGALLGMASIDPWLSEREYSAEARRCVTELGFVALKLHPLAHNIAPNHGESEKVFRCADELGVPVIVHTGLGTPWSQPSLCLPPARQFPELPIILAHCGWGVFTAEALVAAEICDNLVLEPSWCPAYAVQKMVSQFGSERLLLGTDHLTNVPVELAKFRAIGLSDDQLVDIFDRNPRRVFGIESTEA